MQTLILLRIMDQQEEIIGKAREEITGKARKEKQFLLLLAKNGLKIKLVIPTYCQKEWFIRNL